MISARTVTLAIAVLGLLVLQYTVRPILDWRAGIDFLVIALLVLAVRVRPGAAAAAGFAIGLIADALTPEAFGAGALAMTLVGFAASRLKAGFFAENIWLNAVFVFVGKVAFDVVYALAEQRLGGMELLGQLFVWTPLAALATAVVGLIVMAMVRPSFERRHR
ncbi:MAG: rod shape-determining protein MreD [Gemmatimonadales bacterium]|nr:rod shape-determining protein MreD [Gemmatimonadota bacterium]MCL4213615.1 rod shape-determining protein MreD [Gemmatimonadales bacterium]